MYIYSQLPTISNVYGKIENLDGAESCRKPATPALTSMDTKEERDLLQAQQKSI